MLHLGRAIGDAPDARYPAERLAAIALETASGPALDAKLASAAVRALERAAEDAPSQVDLLEALSALELRLGHPRDAERHVNAAIALAPDRARPYALLAQSLRAQGNLEAALAALQSGSDHASVDPILTVERGMVLAARGDLAGAAAAWRATLARDPVHPAAFVSCSALALRAGDPVAAQSLVDAALVASAAHPEVLRRAVQLAYASEADGIARASRVARLCAKLLEAAPGDAAAELALARALVTLGDRGRARAHLQRVERTAAGSAAAAEAQMARLALDEPATEVELQSVLRAAATASPSDLGEVAARARRLATLHGAWPGWLAAAVAERRRGQLTAARGALEVAIEVAPGAVPAHLELAAVLVALREPASALEHAEKARALEGETPRALAALARALAAAGRPREAREAAGRALAMQPEDAGLQSLLAGLREARRTRGWIERVRELFRRS
jgi:tetratricopeptide (TPR) repeat protein